MRAQLVRRIKYLLARTVHSPWYGPLVGLLSLLATLSMSVPTTAVLIPAVMLSSPRWRQTFIYAAMGSGIGGGLISAAFQAWQWDDVYRSYPEFAHADAWRQVLAWMHDYGLYALTAIAALPLPQTPALIFCGITRVSLPGIFLAMFLGKLLKYGLLAWMAATFPERFIRYLHKE